MPRKCERCDYVYNEHVYNFCPICENQRKLLEKLANEDDTDVLTLIDHELNQLDEKLDDIINILNEIRDSLKISKNRIQDE